MSESDPCIGIIISSCYTELHNDRPIPPLALALFQTSKYWKPVVVSQILASILTGGVGIVSISMIEHPWTLHGPVLIICLARRTLDISRSRRSRYCSDEGIVASQLRANPFNRNSTF